MILLEVGTGSGSPKASTQYDLPVSKLPQSAVMEGFYIFSERLFFGLVMVRKGKRLPIA
jgi:hypothetical protein